MDFNPTKHPNWTADDNPRNRKRLRRKERGPILWKVGNAEIAAEAGVKESAVRTAVPQKGRTLRAVVEYVMSKWWRRSRRLSEREVRENLGDDYAKWEKRWPCFDLWTCGAPGCDELRLERGFCAKHGGAPIVDLDVLLRFRIRVGDRWSLLARVIAGAPEGRYVSHLDGNRWNCLPENLRIETVDEWRARTRKGSSVPHNEGSVLPDSPEVLGT